MGSNDQPYGFVSDIGGYGFESSWPQKDVPDESQAMEQDFAAAVENIPVDEERMEQ